MNTLITILFQQILFFFRILKQCVSSRQQDLHFFCKLHLIVSAFLLEIS